MRPMVPMEIKSSMPTAVFSNFLAMNTTSRRFLSIRTERAVPSSFGSRATMSASSSGVSGWGSGSAPPI